VPGRDHHGRVDLDAFARDGYVAIRNAVDTDTVAACRQLIWAALAHDRAAVPGTLRRGRHRLRHRALVPVDPVPERGPRHGEGRGCLPVPPVHGAHGDLSGLFRLPTPDGPVWLKAIPAFAAAEPAAIAAFAEVDPGLVPTVLASGPGRLLLTDVPGADCWDPSSQVVVDAVHRLATAQARISQPPRDIPDRRPEALAAAVRDLLDGPVGSELSPEDLRAARSLQWRWEMLADCGLPDTVVHGDFHPGNWRSADGTPVVLDFADAHLGNPVLDVLRAIDFLPPALRSTAAGAWTAVWTAAAPRSRPAEALRIAKPLAHLAYAVRYQEFLDNIEPSERVYHLGDPVATIRQALACAPLPVQRGLLLHVRELLGIAHGV
jgi:hypothetical protein